jgi:hypothetical protein
MMTPTIYSIAASRREKLFGNKVRARCQSTLRPTSQTCLSPRTVTHQRTIPSSMVISLKDLRWTERGLWAFVMRLEEKSEHMIWKKTVVIISGHGYSSEMTNMIGNAYRIGPGRFFQSSPGSGRTLRLTPLDTIVGRPFPCKSSLLCSLL